jgi:hypothetical protein
MEIEFDVGLNREAKEIRLHKLSLTEYSFHVDRNTEAKEICFFYK